MGGGLKRRALRRKVGDGRRKRGRRENGWTERGMISKRRDCRGSKCMTDPHGGVYHQTSNPHKSGTNMKRKNLRCVIWTVRRTVQDVIDRPSDRDVRCSSGASHVRPLGSVAGTPRPRPRSLSLARRDIQTARHRRPYISQINIIILQKYSYQRY